MKHREYLVYFSSHQCLGVLRPECCSGYSPTFSLLVKIPACAKRVSLHCEDGEAREREENQFCTDLEAVDRASFLAVTWLRLWFARRNCRSALNGSIPMLSVALRWQKSLELFEGKRGNFSGLIFLHHLKTVVLKSQTNTLTKTYTCLEPPDLQIESGILLTGFSKSSIYRWPLQ